jgi:hypothetical protein
MTVTLFGRSVRLALLQSVKKICKCVGHPFINNRIKHMSQPRAQSFLLLAGPLHERRVLACRQICFCPQTLPLLIANLT